jgi:hypothetical protein
VDWVKIEEMARELTAGGDLTTATSLQTIYGREWMLLLLYASRGS